jgi:precorrin-6A/cobalt-precorrin-6A reductase
MSAQSMGARPALVLGGTAEARRLAAALQEQGVPVTSSLAGRVSRPRLPPGEVRVGGFGGPEGLARWLREAGTAAVVDATHPFAEGIAATAVGGCELAGTPLLRLERPGWSAGPGDRWTWVDDQPAAAATIPGLGSRVLLTTGRQGLAAFADVGDAWFLVRCVEPPEPPLPPHHELLLDRGPYALEDELALIDSHRIDLIVTKDSGGEHTAAKLDAARRRSLPVIVVRRPARPVGVETVGTVEEALAWALAAAGARDSVGA